jgi:alcohol/geraniol dehydrogenase (NADP+)
MTIKGWAATAAKQPLQPFEYDPGPLAADDVEIAVEHCGLCHSDLSMLNNDWGITSFPLIPGHEVIGKIVALGSNAKGRSVGQRVGVGWVSSNCMHCEQCIGGHQNLCPTQTDTIIGRHGGFADRIRVAWPWAIPLPDDLDAREAGPLLCAGTTIFSPFRSLDIPPTARVGVVGIGGLGHLALKFANAWGCEVTAFTSTGSKANEAHAFGAHNIVNSRDEADIKKAAGSFDLLIVTSNVTLDWAAMVGTLRPQGKMHIAGAPTEPIPVGVFDLMFQDRSISSSPNGAPLTTVKMLEFAARHKILPQTEHFPLAQVNDAIQHLADGKARYRVVIDM